MGRVGDFYLNKHALFLNLGCCNMGKHYVITFKLYIFYTLSYTHIS